MQVTHYDYHGGHIIHLEFPTHLSMVLGIARAQEFAEHAEYKGQWLDFGQFFDKVVKAQESDEYITELYGINMHAAMYQRWLERIDLTKQESMVRRLLGNNIDNAYIIGSLAGDSDTKNHEFAHAFYGLNHVYRQNMLDKVLNLPSKYLDKSANYFMQRNYDPASFNDERQAFFATSSDKEIWEFFQVKPYFRRHFEEYFNTEISNLVKA